MSLAKPAQAAILPSKLHRSCTVQVSIKQKVLIAIMMIILKDNNSVHTYNSTFTVFIATSTATS